MEKKYSTPLLTILLLFIGSASLFAQNLVGAGVSPNPTVNFSRNVNMLQGVVNYTPNAANPNLNLNDIYNDLNNPLVNQVNINSGNANNDNILINTSINYSGAGGKTLRFSSKNIILVNQPINSVNSINIEFVAEGLDNGTPNAAVNINGQINTNGGNLIVQANSNLNIDAIQVNQPINTGGGNVNFNGVNTNTPNNPNSRGFFLNTNINTGGGNININGVSQGNTPSVFIQGVINSGAGSININGSNANMVGTNSTGVYIFSPINSTSGNITIEGTTSGEADGVLVEQQITSVNGNITINGFNRNPNNPNNPNMRGFRNAENGNISTTGTGSINLIGRSFGNEPALAVNSPITSGGNNINLNGINGGTGPNSIGVRINSPLSSLGLPGNGRIEESEAVGEIVVNGTNTANAPAVSIAAAVQTNNNNIVITGTNTGSGANAVGILINNNTLRATGMGVLNLIGSTGANDGRAINSLVNISSNSNIVIRTDRGGFNAPAISSNVGAISLSVATGANLNVINNINTSSGAAIAINFGDNSLRIGIPALAGSSFVGGTVTNGINTISPAVYISRIVGTIAIKKTNASFTPATPQSITAQAGSGQVTLSWTEQENAVGYQVYILSPNQVQRLVGTTDKTAFTVTGLQNATTYFFKIVAIGADASVSEFSATVSARPSVVLGTEEETANNLFRVYPNPSNGSLSLRISELKGRNAQINVVDMSGRVVFNQAISANGSLETELNLNLANGMYFLQVSTEKENLRKKIVMSK